MKSQISTVLVGWIVLPVHFYVKWFSMSSSFDVQYFFLFYCLAIAFIVIHALEKLPTTTHLFNCMNPIAHCESDRETTHNIDFDNIWRWHSSVAWFFFKLFFCFSFGRSSSVLICFCFSFDFSVILGTLTWVPSRWLGIDCATKKRQFTSNIDGVLSVDDLVLQYSLLFSLLHCRRWPIENY